MVTTALRTERNAWRLAYTEIGRIRSPWYQPVVCRDECAVRPQTRAGVRALDMHTVT